MTYRIFTENRGRSDFSSYFNDFLGYATSDWVITTTEAGAGAATEVAGGGNGILVVTNDNADNDLDAFQYAGGSGAVIENIRWVAGKKSQFVARFSLSDADATDLMIGAYITDTDPIGGVTDGMYFRVVNGSAALTFVLEKNSTETVFDTGVVLADNTYVKVEYYYDGSNFLVYVNDRRVGKMAITNLPDDEDLALSFVIQNGAAAAKVLNLDYIGFAQER